METQLLLGYECPICRGFAVVDGDPCDTCLAVFGDFLCRADDVPKVVPSGWVHTEGIGWHIPWGVCHPRVDPAVRRQERAELLARLETDRDLRLAGLS